MKTSRNQILFRRGPTDRLVALDDTDGNRDKIAYGEPVYDVEKGYLSVGVRDENNNFMEYSQLFPVKVRTMQG